MSQLTELNAITTIADTDVLYVLRAADPGDPDKQVTAANLRAPSKTETLLNKQIGNPATTKPVYASLLQLVGAKITHLYRATGNITISALAAGAEETLTLAVVGAAVGDSVQLSPTAAPEAGVAVAAAWVSAADTVSVRVQNNSAGALAGGNLAVVALVTRSAAADV